MENNLYNNRRPCLLISCLCLDSTFVQVPATNFLYNGSVLVQDMACEGDEVSPLSCRNNFTVDSTCTGPQNAAVIECTEDIDYGKYSLL